MWGQSCYVADVRDLSCEEQCDLWQAAKQELTRQFNAAERERKSKKKPVSEVAQKQRELDIAKKQQVTLIYMFDFAWQAKTVP